MLESSLRRILDTLPGDALVLDVGGWARPLARADWVLDIMPYESRGLYGRDGEGPERFSAQTWVQRDMCDREPWPFGDAQFDFAVCSHTLEDVRDPIWVCHELNRVARAGYIEVPSRLEEQSCGVHGPWVGWSHHRWLVDVDEQGLVFVGKPGVLHTRQAAHFPAGFHETLRPEEKVQQLWWEGGFAYRERVMLSADELDPYLEELVARHRPARAGGALARMRSLLRR